MSRITKKKIEYTILTAQKLLQINISADHAKKILQADRDLISEVDESGKLDTLPRSDFAGAFIEVFMPGEPTVQDDLLFDKKLDYWTWPCIGSSQKYKRAFWKHFRQKMKEHGVKFNTKQKSE